MTTTPLPASKLDRFFLALHESPVRRSTTDRRVAGVCSAVAERLGVSPQIVRVLTVVAAVLGVGVPAYLVAWLLLPDTNGTVHLERAIRQGAAGSIVLMVLTALAVLPGPHAHPITSWVAVAAIIAGLWVVGGRRAAGSPTRPTGSGSAAGEGWPQTPTGPQDAPRG